MLEFLFNSYLFFVILYFLGVNLAYSFLLILSLREIIQYMRHNSFSDFRLTVQSELAAGVSVLAPAYNESETITESVKSLLKLSYGQFEVIVINDGSNDDTLIRLVDHFGLHTSQHVYEPTLRTQKVRGIYRSKLPAYANLTVIDKENGGKSDALNAGINVARHDLYCAIDADSLLEDDALQKVVKPFLEDSRVIASGGIVRIANGCDISNGRVINVGLSKKLLPQLQVVEYLRAFLSGRMAWQAMNALPIISGAFGMFRKQAVLDVGGYRNGTVGEDMELVIRLHRVMLERRKPYRIVFVPDPVCWTEVPEYLWVLARQRNRWHRGLIDTVRIHKHMLLNPRYGVIGMAALPFFVLVELLGPVVELVGYIVMLVMLLMGIADLQIAALFFVAAVIYGVLFSVGGVLLEEISFRRYPNPSHLILLLTMGIVENFGYRQLTAWWRIKAFWDYMLGRHGWGAMQRSGFGTSRLES